MDNNNHVICVLKDQTIFTDLERIRQAFVNTSDVRQNLVVQVGSTGKICDMHPGTSVRLSAWAPGILTAGFHGSPQFLYKKFKKMSSIRKQQLPFASLPIQYALPSCQSMLYCMVFSCQQRRNVSL
jgi:hypothetical protein